MVLLEVRLRGTQGQLVEARGPPWDESSGGSDAQTCWADAVARLEEELRAVRVMLRESRGEVDRLRAELEAAVNNARQAHRRSEAVAGERDEAAAERSRLEFEAAGLRSEVDAARRAMAKASRRARQGARVAAEAWVRADEAESAARVLRDQVDQPGSDHRGGQDEHERGQVVHCQDVEDACSRSEPEREGEGTLSEALIDLERRFADILNHLNPNSERAEWSDAATRALPYDGAEPDETPGASAEGGGRLDLVVEVTRRLTEARQSNQRLCSLLGVLGLSKEAASQMTRQQA
jgi:hypothetical protein